MYHDHFINKDNAFLNYTLSLQTVLPGTEKIYWCKGISYEQEIRWTGHDFKKTVTSWKFPLWLRGLRI